MEEIANHCDKILVINRGEIYKYGTPKEIFGESEKLSEFGLEAPQVTRLCNILRARGVDLPRDIYTVDEAFRAISALLERRRGDA